jgi:hypothetical protein
MDRPVNSNSEARPWPMILGNREQAPISHPASPTRVKRKAVFARGVKIGCHGEYGARAGADAVHRRDDGLRACAHGLDQIPGHACELEQARGIPMGERTDDLVDIAAGTEILSRARQHDGANAAFRGQRGEQREQFSVGVERQRVLAFRPIQRHDADSLFPMP